MTKDNRAVAELRQLLAETRQVTIKPVAPTVRKVGNPPPYANRGWPTEHQAAVKGSLYGHPLSDLGASSARY